MDIGKSITFLYEDERWLEKIGIGVALVLISMALSVVLIGVVGFFILGGYSIRLMRNVRDGAARPLPEWDRWGEDMATGFKLFVVMLIYALPIFAVMIPATVGGVIASQGRGGEGFGIVMILCTILLAFLYSFFLTVMQPGITIAYARDEQISSGLEVGLIWEWTRRNIGPVLIVTLLYWAVGAVVGILAPIAGIILCVVGLIVTIPLGILLPYLIQAHLFGQLARIPMESARMAPGTLDAYAWGATESQPAAPAAPEPWGDIETEPPVFTAASEEPVAAVVTPVEPIAPVEVVDMTAAETTPAAAGPVAFDAPAEPAAPAEPSVVQIEPEPAPEEPAGEAPDAPASTSDVGPEPDEPQNPA